MITDRAHVADGQFILYVAPDMDQQTLSAARTEPMPLRSKYPQEAKDRGQVLGQAKVVELVSLQKAKK